MASAYINIEQFYGKSHELTLDFNLSCLIQFNSSIQLSSSRVDLIRVESSWFEGIKHACWSNIDCRPCLIVNRQFKMIWNRQCQVTTFHQILMSNPCKVSIPLYLCLSLSLSHVWHPIWIQRYVNCRHTIRAHCCSLLMVYFASFTI